MKYYQGLFTIFFACLATWQSCAQTHNKYYVLKIKTVDGVYKGRLTHIMDSSIEIMNKQNGTNSVFTASQINIILIRKSFLPNAAGTAVAGGLAAAVLVAGYYLEQYWTYGRPDPSDPPFGYALWTTTAFGAAVGLLYGSIESLFLHKKLRVYRELYMFENKRGKMKKYLYY